jgi:hypothetical protein
MNWQNQFKSKSFEEFNQTFFKQHSYRTWRYFGTKIIVPVDNERHVEIDLMDGRLSSGTFSYYLCRLVNKKTGPISVHEFEFNELTGPKNSCHGYEVIAHCGKDWYMNGPDAESVQKLSKKIMNWIEAVS